MSLSEIAAKNQTNLRFVPNSELEREESENARVAEQEAMPLISMLSRHVEDVYERNKRYRQESGVEEQMLEAMRQRDSSYSDEKLARLNEQGGSTVFIGLTGVKCRAAEAWIFDVVGSDREKIWSLQPTPVPDIPDDQAQMIVQRVMAGFTQQLDTQGVIMPPQVAYDMASRLRDQTEEEIRQEAADRAERMERTIDDQLAEGGFEAAFSPFVTNVVTLKAGILKGPILRRKKTLKYRKTAFGGKTVAVEHVRLQTEFENVNPLDFYPSDGMIDVNDGDTCERVRFTRKSLLEMRDVPGYDTDAINLIIRQNTAVGQASTWFDAIRAKLENRAVPSTENPDLIEGVEFWGSISGVMLASEGIDRTPDGKPIRLDEEYDISCVKIGPHVIHVAFNPFPLAHKPYSKTGWAPIPGSFWFKGVPELMRDLQTVCNAAARSLVNNLGMASAPQVVIEDINRIARGQNLTGIRPWKIWQFVNRVNSQAKPIDFFNIESHAQELSGVYDQFAKMADDFTGIPAYAYGNEKISGAGRTASGLSMLMSSAARGIKRVILRMDREAIGPLVMRLYNWNMVYNPDESIKGDVRIMPKGIMALLAREQMASQRMEFLANTANVFDQEIMGPERRANVLREAAIALQMPADEVIPPKREMKERAAQIEQARAQQAQAETTAATAAT